jgi:hypothetical protein
MFSTSAPLGFSPDRNLLIQVFPEEKAMKTKKKKKSDK